MAVSTGASGNDNSPGVILTSESDQGSPNKDAVFEGLLALVSNKMVREHGEALAKGKELSGPVSWAGFGHTYFLFAALPEGEAEQKISAKQNGPAVIVDISGQTASSASAYTIFIGPKELDVLKSLNKGLEQSIDFGWFGLVSMPLLYVMHFFHRLTRSYGLDIILLTILIKLILAPLTHKSFVSMKQMQKLQPQMEKLKEKYSGDKEKLNKEIMELYRRNGVNPLGGCLPMVFQFPVFIGLYNALSTPIELRHAPFLWIKDLSRPDWESLPFTFGSWHLGIPILTILMGASMFLQQWMTPSAGDPNQRKMMMLMPLIFTFMFVSFPAGLTVYWLINNLLSIGQQYWINRHVK
jgi:YidC/Oxa1 family membrane protein insertase